MEIRRLESAERYEPEPNWTRISLCNEQALSIEHFVKPPGHASPMHHHPQEQVLFVIKGRMSVRSGDGNEATLHEGDTVHFASNEPHIVLNETDEPVIGLDIFSPGRSFDFWLKR